MKKIFYIALSIVAATFVACNEDIAVGEVDLGYLKLVESNVNFDYRGGNGKIVVDTQSPITATVATDGTWATTSVSGNTVTVTASMYTGKESRNSSVTLRAGDRSVVVPISQTSSALQLSANTLLFGKQESSQTVTFTPADAPITVTVVEADRSWLSAEVKEEGIVVSAEGNTGSERKSVVSVVFGSQEAEIAVTQATSLSTSVTALDYTYGASSKSLTFDVTDGVTVTATASESWVTPTVNMAAKTVTVAVAANDKLVARNATVTLETNGGVKANIAITQAAKPLQASDLVGNWTVEYFDYFDETYLSTQVVITRKSDTTINIAGLLGAVPTANFDATFNSNNGTVSIADRTVLNGAQAGGLPIYSGRASGTNPVVITVHSSESPLVMDTPVAQATADIWGFNVNGTTSWVFLTLHTIWTKR